MRWFSTISRAETLDRAIGEVAGAVDAAFAAPGPDLLLVFVSHLYGPRVAEAVPRLRQRLRRGAAGHGPTLLGSSAAGVIGGGSEAEIGPGIALVAASLPGVECTPLRIGPELARAPDQGRLEALPGLSDPAPSALVLMGDARSVDPHHLLPALDELWPRTVKVGGLASGPAHPEGIPMFLDDEAIRGGVLGLALRGRIEAECLVSQGCRPVGHPMFVTARDGIRICELDGRPALEALERLFAQLEPPDRRLAQRSLFLGVAPRGDLERYETGDFLIRNIIGVEAATGALAAAVHVHDGTVVQFHVRDPRTAAGELEHLLARRARRGKGRLRGGLLFSCLGRGVALYGDEGRESARIRDHLGELPFGGFFCNGEIGAIHGQTQLHGYTSALALFSDPPTQ